eukprot:CAMPEP_0117007786 /NCGR_PEP_ID=MMETSP0472-20121206/7541_1 /TAXON_ID=693140 ORGANISM="Tiarina fusus, Strain LIS" /NCGR_SAMPLE_ID=MMETSP0472 /ASSEMBLY_ACC=CAM_ASM_000603 /LENGTH=144 /DNA_ID=CAMNT_0004709653 /DNA_START=21 /DNA_END=455 /DNA_ORIENTATION=-
MSSGGKKRTFKKFYYRGIDLDSLMEVSTEDFGNLVTARARRRLIKRGLTRKYYALNKKLRKAKKEAVQGEKPAVVRTHLRDAIVVPEMVGSQVGVYNGVSFNAVEIKPEMIGHYLGEFSITYKPVRHGRPGIGATNSSRFIPLK